jgi:hypothetical protein
MSFRQQVAQWSAERRQREVNQEFENLQDQYHELEEQAEQAVMEGNRDDFAYYDRQLDEVKQQMAPYVNAIQAQQAAQVHPGVRQFDYQNKDYINRLERRYGPQGAVQKLAEVDGYITRPKIPNETNPAKTGMGIPRNSPAYFKAAEDLLEIHGEKFFGEKYDPASKQLTYSDAAAASNQSYPEYCQSWHELRRQGRI